MDNHIDVLAADNIRILSAAMVEKAQSGHPGGAMGGADFIHILFAEFLHFDPQDMTWRNRDRFFLDPGHMSPMLYAVLTLTGHFKMEELKKFRQWGSPTPGHPEKDQKRGIENTSGPLGQGHVMAVGAAITERFLAARFGDWMSHKTYTYISDGGIQEEVSQGAGRLAGHLGLGNLIMFYDSNGIQLSSETDDVTSENTAAKYEAWGWHVQTIDGHNHQAIRQALKQAIKEEDKPSLIIGKTIMGKGAVDEEGKPFEKKVSTHGMPLSKAGASFEKTIENLGGDPENPFMIFPEVSEYYSRILKEKKEYAEWMIEQQNEWERTNPDLSDKWDLFFSHTLPELDFADIEQQPDIATRGASGKVLQWLAGKVENIIVSSADLSNSDKTDGYLKNTRIFVKDDFSGSFLQSGVSELTMAAIANGMALHGGVIPVCGTFFVFSDFMKPAVRLAALMELPVKYIWTHDAFRVGEDGPTHQPVEQEAQIRLLEQIRNHSGISSVLVLRPADAQETTVGWKMALENSATPTALILSRQGIKDLPAVSGDRYKEALKASLGAYIVEKDEGVPQLILVANGSEVSTLIEGAALLRKEKGLRIQVVSAISEGLFDLQPEKYRKEVIPDNIPVIGLTAGLPSTLKGLVGCNGEVIGLISFGYSAPYKVLDEKLGFTGLHLYEEVCRRLALD